MNLDKQRKPAINGDHINYSLSEKKAKNRPLMVSQNPGELLFIFAMTGLFFALAITAMMKGYVLLSFIIIAYSHIFFIWKCAQLDAPRAVVSQSSIRYVSGTEWKNKNNHFSPAKQRERDIQRLAKAKLSNRTYSQTRSKPLNTEAARVSPVVPAVVAGSLLNSKTLSDDTNTSNLHDNFYSNNDIPDISFSDTLPSLFDEDNHTAINPANGDPMIGGAGGVDIEGNSYGTDNDSMTTASDLFEDSTSFMDDSMSGMDDSWSSNDDW